MNNISSEKILVPEEGASPYVNKFSVSASIKKDQHIETLRGLAIILVVLGHMIGYSKTGGMKVADHSAFRYIYNCLEYIQMALFTAISGWVYANKPILKISNNKFLKGKLQRLVLPMFVFSIILFLFRMVIPGTNSKPALSEMPRILIFPYDVYWYLYSLLLIFLVIMAIDRRPWFRKIEGWAVALFISFILLFISENWLDAVPNAFSFKGAAYLLPFFLLGIGSYRYKELLLSTPMTMLYLTVFIAATVVQQVIWFGYFPLQEKVSILGMAIGISSVMLLFKLKLENHLLVWIGGYAFGIFLFHVFFTGGIRIAMLKAGVQNQWAILILGVLGAISFSIAVQRLISKSGFLGYYLLGIKPEKTN